MVICKHCGREFTPKGNFHVLCDDACRAAVKRERQKRDYHRQKKAIIQRNRRYTEMEYERAEDAQKRLQDELQAEKRGLRPYRASTLAGTRFLDAEATQEAMNRENCLTGHCGAVSWAGTQMAAHGSE